MVLTLLWLAGIVGILVFGPFLPHWQGQLTGRATAFLALTELIIVLRGIVGFLPGIRLAAAG